MHLVGREEHLLTSVAVATATATPRDFDHGLSARLAVYSVCLVVSYCARGERDNYCHQGIPFALYD
jgi:hypothetical protein